MNGLCILAGKLMVAIPVTSFSLLTTDPVDRSRQDTEWRIRGQQLISVPTPTAGRLDTGMKMSLAIGREAADKPRTVDTLRLTIAPQAAQYELCVDTQCRPLPSLLPGIDTVALVELKPCPEEKE